MPEPSTTDAEFQDAVRTWERAQLVYNSPRGNPDAWIAFERVVSRPDDFHDLLVGVLKHSSQLVVAYSLLALERMRSPVLLSLPPELLTRRDKITIAAGSFNTSMDVGGLARQLSKKASEHVA